MILVHLVGFIINKSLLLLTKCVSSATKRQNNVHALMFQTHWLQSLLLQIENRAASMLLNNFICPRWDFRSNKLQISCCNGVYLAISGVVQVGAASSVTSALHIQAANMVTAMDPHGSAYVIQTGAESFVIKVGFELSQPWLVYEQPLV